MARPDSPSLPPLLYRGSVKDVHGISGENSFYFRYSDRYSVFDWGEMPDSLPGKGEALANIADCLFRFFEAPEAWRNWSPVADFAPDLLAELQRKGLAHHSRGLVGEACMEVGAVDVLRPELSPEGYDYSAYQKRPVDSLVPLEVIFRFGVPEGSSFRKRAESDPGVLADVGLREVPKEGDRFSVPIVEFSTKLEPTDRALRAKEAREIAGLSELEFRKLVDLTRLVALRLKDIVDLFGAELWDGKFEFAFIESKAGGREFQLVDSIGPDELRILRDGVHLSKECLRQVYRGSSWYRATIVAKEIAVCENSKDWKSICRDRLGERPLPLSPEVKAAAQLLYPALAKAFQEAVAGNASAAKAALFPAVEALQKVRSL